MEEDEEEAEEEDDEEDYNIEEEEEEEEDWFSDEDSPVVFWRSFNSRSRASPEDAQTHTTAKRRTRRSILA